MAMPSGPTTTMLLGSACWFACSLIVLVCPLPDSGRARGGPDRAGAGRAAGPGRLGWRRRRRPWAAPGPSDGNFPPLRGVWTAVSGVLLSVRDVHPALSGTSLSYRSELRGTALANHEQDQTPGTGPAGIEARDGEDEGTFRWPTTGLPKLFGRQSDEEEAELPDPGPGDMAPDGQAADRQHALGTSPPPYRAPFSRAAYGHLLVPSPAPDAGESGEGEQPPWTPAPPPGTAGQAAPPAAEALQPDEAASLAETQEHPAGLASAEAGEQPAGLAPAEAGEQAAGPAPAETQE